MERPACQPGATYVPFPVGTVNIPISGIRKAYEIQASLPPSLNESWRVIESYSMAGVQAVEPDSTAFPERQNNLLISPFVMYEPSGNVKVDKKVDAEAFRYGKQIRGAIAGAAGEKLYAYMNYVSGEDETIEEKYGHETWRIEKLRRLKKEYDPKGRFKFYNPTS
jgi:FAD/FMN-containing dehydrogenase